MSGLLGNLSSTTSALQAQSKAVELTAKNIANVNNPNYARQRLSGGSISTTAGGGVETVVTLEVQQIRDKYLDSKVIQEVSYSSSLSARDSRLRELLGVLGESIDRVNDPAFIGDTPADDGGIRSSLNDFFNAFENFSARPTDEASKFVVMQSAEDIVNALNRSDSRIDVIEASIDTEINTELNAFNNRLIELSEMNKKIAKVEAVTGLGSAADLRDERQATLEQISGFIQIEVTEVDGANGQVSLSVRDSSGDQVEILRPSYEPYGVFYDSANNAFRSRNSSENLDLQAGKLSSLSQVKGDDIVQLRSQMDDLANTIATEVNELYYQAFVPAGVDPAVPEMSFFAQPTPPPSVSGVPSTVDAGNIALYAGSSDPLVTSSVPLSQDSLRASGSTFAGSNDIAKAIAGLPDLDFSGLGGQRMAGFVTGIAVGIAQDIESVSNQLEVQKDMEALIKDQRAQVSGVSMDEELANLIQYQRAFQATSRVFSVLSEMLETVVTGLR